MVRLIVLGSCLLPTLAWSQDGSHEPLSTWWYLLAGIIGTIIMIVLGILHKSSSFHIGEELDPKRTDLPRDREFTLDEQRHLLALETPPVGNETHWFSMQAPMDDRSSRVPVPPFRGPLVNGLEEPHLDQIKRMMRRGWKLTGMSRVEMAEDLMPREKRFRDACTAHIASLKEGVTPDVLPQSMKPEILIDLLSGRLFEEPTPNSSIEDLAKPDLSGRGMGFARTEFADPEEILRAMGGEDGEPVDLAKLAQQPKE